MKASELIKELQTQIDRIGDVEVIVSQTLVDDECEEYNENYDIDFIGTFWDEQIYINIENK